MKKNGRDFTPNVKPVTRIALPEKNILLRILLAVGFLVIGLGCIGAGLMSALSTEPGWQEVEASSNQPNLGGEFKLMYNFSGSSSAATAQKKQLTSLYTQAVEDAYRIFSAYDLEDGLQNVAYLNAHPNEPVEVEEALYQALALTAEYSDRHVFLAPANVEYNRVFSCENDLEAALYVPADNPETVQWLSQLARFINDPEMIRLEMLGDNRVRLYVSEEYLAFAEENEIEIFLDFGWMTNAFVADYMAQILTEAGFCNGYLSSFDGFTRNLDPSGQRYLLNVFDRQGTEAYLPARVPYTAPASIVALRDYPVVEEDRWHYYAFESGEIVTIFLDPADCMSKSAIHDLLSYSADLGCAEILLQTVGVFLAEDFQAETLSTLARGGVYSLWYEGNVLKYNDDANPPELLTENGESQYSICLEK